MVVLRHQKNGSQPGMAVLRGDLSYYERNLPHWQPEGASIFLTWRLYGSLPASVVEARNKLNEERLRRSKDADTARNGCATSAGDRFRILDRALDRATTGPFWLREARVADCVVDVMRKGERELGYFDLHAFVVMPNHVHLLITPKIALSRIMDGLKGASSRAANLILSRTGQHFWQDESFDRWVRDAKEFERVCAYIERNPVSAGLVAKAGEWKWSSAGALGDGG
jgi:putative transposase